MRRVGVGALVACAAIAGVYALTHPPTAERVVHRGDLVFDRAIRGPLVRSIAATGVLASRSVRVVASGNAGTVVSLDIRPGSRVVAGQAVARLENPDLDAQRSAALVDVASARAEALETRAAGRTAERDALEALAAADAAERETRAVADNDRNLLAAGFVRRDDTELAAIKHDNAARERTLAQAKIAEVAADERARADVAEVKIAAALARVDAIDREIAALAIVTREDGVVQDVPIEVGQHVDAGTIVAHVADARDLKAVLSVPDAVVRDVALGQRVTLDLAGSRASARVDHIAPAATSGSVEVDAALEGEPPRGARPDSSVDGSIVVGDLRDVVSIARPAGVVDSGTLALFKISDDGTHLVRVRASLGRGSDERVPVLAGLRPGDTVVVSDTTALDGIERIALAP
jgi:multidrug efflux pump subunit AcrA (membrane-fusion protein)